MVSFIIHGVCGQYATLVENGDIDPSLSVVSPRELSRRVLLPLPTGPMMAVICPFGTAKLMPWRIGGPLGLHAKLAFWNSSTLVEDEPEDGREESSSPSPAEGLSDNASTGAFVQYFSIRLKQETDSQSEGSV